MITAIVDLQFGSTGKGLIAGFLSQKNDYDLAVSANMPNAGHTFVDSQGRAWVNKVLPSGVYSKSLRGVCIGPGAVFSIAQLKKEIVQLRERGIPVNVYIHETAGILFPEHAEQERNTLSKISSTMQGSMAALVQKMRRDDEHFKANVAKNYLPEIASVNGIVLSHPEWVQMMASGKNILIEGSQGYSLGLNAGFYPHCTSRDCTVWRLLADAGAVLPCNNGHRPLHVIGTARVHPIRVGNTPDGFSGGTYADQQELTWEDVGQTPETTTVTGRERRVFSFSELQIREAMLANSVNEVFLNFCNYDPALAIKVAKIINKAHVEHGGENPFGDPERAVRYMGFGPAAKDILEVGRYE